MSPLGCSLLMLAVHPPPVAYVQEHCNDDG
jgi:hypothetical protein